MNLIGTPPGTNALPATVTQLRRRAVRHAALGSVGVMAAAALLYPKVMAIAAGGFGVIGTGMVANLALAFGSLMFLREAQRARVAGGMSPRVQPAIGSHGESIADSTSPRDAE